MDEVNNLVAFKAISNFVKDLNTVMGEKKHNVALYARLVEKTTIAHEEPIRKHVTAFTGYCTANRDSILEKDISKITAPRIEYSEKVYLDMIEIFEAADAETKDAIYQHLLAIASVVDPTSNAKKILREAMEKKTVSDGSNEGEFINKLISKVENAVDPDSMKDPITAVTSILSNGAFREVFSELQTGLGNGSLDMGKMLGAMAGMMGGGAGGGGMDLGALMGMMGGAGGNPLAALMGGGAGGANPLAALMGGLAGGANPANNPSLALPAASSSNSAAPSKSQGGKAKGKKK